jgi:hypothetical protein
MKSLEIRSLDIRFPLQTKWIFLLSASFSSSPPFFAFTYLLPFYHSFHMQMDEPICMDVDMSIWMDEPVHMDVDLSAWMWTCPHGCGLVHAT